MNLTVKVVRNAILRFQTGRSEKEDSMTLEILVEDAKGICDKLTYEAKPDMPNRDYSVLTVAKLLHEMADRITLDHAAKPVRPYRALRS